MDDAYIKQPAITGYYWMRWKSAGRGRRNWRYDVVWFSEGSPENVRLIVWGPITLYPYASFHGPLVAPAYSGVTGEVVVAPRAG